ncbi:ion transporter [Microbacterium sp. W1N]|uniref:ion transporter n=1 Tax=Microbacterium festucae TaxID=2977531 RepID=UPI0021C149DE|nr:ion transporter [Microbacterium festucae]MCT9820946.1 ion transporter [Microbacterium festucae]
MARRLVRPRQRDELKNIPYEVFIGLLSVLSIVNIVLWWVFYNDPQIQTVLTTMTALFTVVFLVDFLYRFFTAPARAHYFWRDFGWADLLSAVPATQLNILRVFRLRRVVHLFHRTGARHILLTVVRDRANSALLLLLLAGVLVMQFGSLVVLYAEAADPTANITTASDALWYTLVTISTVGYGDQYPVTAAGRIVGTLIIIVGVGIFGTFTGFLANFFLTPRQRAHAAAAEAETTEPAAVGTETDRAAQLQALLAQTEASAAELRRLLEEERGGSGSAGSE